MDTVTAREFLLDCLRESGLDTEIIEAVAEACLNNGIDAYVLAGRVYGDNDVAAKLFLTQREVTRLINTCITNCAAVGVEPRQDSQSQAEPTGSSRFDAIPIQTQTLALKPQRQVNRSPEPPSCSTPISEGCADPPKSPMMLTPNQPHGLKRVELWLDENPPVSDSEGPLSDRKPACTKLTPGPRGIAGFMRQTASSKAKMRVSRAVAVSPTPGSPHGSDFSKVSKGVVRVSPRLLRLTKSNQIRVTGKADMSVASDATGRPLTTEELKFQQAVADGEREREKLRRGPLSVTSNRSGRSSKSTNLCKPTTQFKPFNLQSVIRHEHAVHQFKKQIEQEHAAEARARQFKAGMIWDEKPIPKSKKVSKPRNGKVSQGPQLQSARRAEYWEKIIKPKQEMREATQRKLDEEKRRKEEVSSAYISKSNRRGLVHQARRMPNFSEVFHPDKSCAAPPTKVRPPRLATQARLGELLKPSDGVKQVTIKVDPFGTTDPFAASLRL